MNWKKVLLWIIGIIAIGFITELTLKFWVKNSLPSFIDKRNDTPYNFDYSDVTYSLLNRKMIISRISITPKTEKKGIYNINVNKITIHGVHFFKFITAKDLVADLIEIDNPTIVIKRNFEYPERKEKLKSYDLGNSIQIGDFIINKGNLTLLDNNNQRKIAALKNLDLHLSGVIWDVINEQKRIPITYNKARLNIEDIFYQLSPTHHLNIKNIKANEGNIEAYDAQIISDMSEKQFFSGKYNSKSFMNIQAPISKIKNLDWGYSNNGIFYAHTDMIFLDSTFIKILGRSDNKQQENITEHIERIIPFDLTIDSIQITKSKLNLNNHVTSEKVNILIQKIENKVNEKITIENLKLYDNLVMIHERQPSQINDRQRKYTYFFDDILEIKNFSIENGQVKYYNIQKVNVMNMSNINYNVKNIIINTLITNTNREIPFTYSNYSLEAKDIRYSGLKNYSFKISDMKLANDIFSATKLEVIPKLTRKQFYSQRTGKNLFKINIKNINIPKINWEIKNDKFNVVAPNITINSLVAEVYNNKNGKSLSKNLQFHDSDMETNINVKSLSVINLSFKRYDAFSGENITNSDISSLTLKNLIFSNNSESTSLGLPFSFSTININSKKIFHDFGDHLLTAKDLTYLNNRLKGTEIKVRPKSSSKTYMKNNGIDAYNIDIAKIEIPDLDLGLHTREFHFVAPLAVFNKIIATIHQYDIPEEKYIPSYKSLFSEKLRNLDFKLRIKEVNLKDSYLSYEEESIDKGTGKIYFNDINAKIHNLNSGYKANTLPDVEVVFHSKFLYSGDFSARWKFNVLNLNDQFTIKGKLINLPAEKINMFIQPYLHASTEGMIGEVTFDFLGDNDIGKGLFKIDYKDLKVTLHKDDGNKEKKLLSSIANIAVKKNSPDIPDEKEIKEVERKKDKSFFNFLWNMVLSGLKETVLIL